MRGKTTRQTGRTRAEARTGVGPHTLLEAAHTGSIRAHGLENGRRYAGEDRPGEDRARTGISHAQEGDAHQSGLHTRAEATRTPRDVLVGGRPNRRCHTRRKRRAGRRPHTKVGHTRTEARAYAGEQPYAGRGHAPRAGRVRHAWQAVGQYIRAAQITRSRYIRRARVRVERPSHTSGTEGHGSSAQR